VDEVDLVDGVDEVNEMDEMELGVHLVHSGHQVHFVHPAPAPPTLRVSVHRFRRLDRVLCGMYSCFRSTTSSGCSRRNPSRCGRPSNRLAGAKTLGSSSPRCLSTPLCGRRSGAPRWAFVPYDRADRFAAEMTMPARVPCRDDRVHEARFRRGFDLRQARFVAAAISGQREHARRCTSSRPRARPLRRVERRDLHRGRLQILRQVITRVPR